MVGTSIVGDYEFPHGEEQLMFRTNSRLLRAVGRPNIGQSDRSATWAKWNLLLWLGKQPPSVSAVHASWFLSRGRSVNEECEVKSQAAKMLDGAIVTFLFLFAAAAPNSIAATQSAWLIGLALWLARFPFSPRPTGMSCNRSLRFLAAPF